MLKTVSSITNAIGALNFKGTWNASTNTPTIVSGVGVKGDYFVVSVAGSTTIDGISNWGVGDWITYNGTVWQRVEGGADLNGVNLSVSGTTTLSNLTASTALALNATKEVVSVTNTGTGNNVLATSPTLVTPILGTPQSGVVTNLTGTASININGTVGATTPAAGSFTSIVSTTNGTQLTLQRTGPSGTNTFGVGGSGELGMVNSAANAIVLYNTFAHFPSAATTASAANAFLDNASFGYANQLLRSTSSAKYKKDVEDLQTDFSQKIYDLRPVWYRSTADADRKDWSWYGLIAEEVAAIEPRLVHWTYADDQYEYVSADIEGSDQQRRALKSDAVKTPDGIQYDRIGVLLLKEMQSLKAITDTQAQTISALEARIAALEGQ